MKTPAIAVLACLAAAAHAAPVDVCALLPQAEAQSVVGKIRNVTTMKPQASLLGECTFDGANGTLSMAARPAGEYEATVKEAAPAEAVQGLAGKAVKTRFGLLYQPAGKSYFLQVIARRAGKDDMDMALALDGARKLKP